MQFEDLSENFRNGIDNFKEFTKCFDSKRFNNKNLKTFLTSYLIYPLLDKNKCFCSLDILKPSDREQLNFVLDLAKKQNYWLEK